MEGVPFEGTDGQDSGGPGGELLNALHDWKLAGQTDLHPSPRRWSLETGKWEGASACRETGVLALNNGKNAAAAGYREEGLMWLLGKH